MSKSKSNFIDKLLGSQTQVEFSDEEENLLNLIHERGGRCNIKDLSHLMDQSAAGIVDLAQQVCDKGVRIWKEDGVLYLSGTTIECLPEHVVIKENKIRIGILADTMLGSKYQQLTGLYSAFQIAEHEGVDVMFHVGVSAGKPTPSKQEEFFLSTAAKQIDYIVANYPKSDKFKTKFVSGFHDMQWKKDNLNILAEVCSRRDDLAYRGDIQSDVSIRRGQAKDKKWPMLKVVYHGGDTSPYSKSYPVQGLVENLIQDVDDLVGEKTPDVVVVAGQGVYLDLSGGKVRNLYAVPGMRLISPSILRRKNRAVAPSIGFVIVTVTFEKDGTFAVKAKCYPLKGIKNDYREKFSKNQEFLRGLNSDERKVLKLLEESPKSSGELEQAINKSPETIDSIIFELQSKGFIISEMNASKNFKLNSVFKKKFNVPPINFDDYFFETVREGDISDTHIGSNSELVPIQEEAFEIFSKRGITVVNHGGDVSNGSPKHDEHFKGEVREFRASPLIFDIIRLLPSRKGIQICMIAGDHDRWFLDTVGLDLIAHVAQARPDINYLGIQDGERRSKRIITLLKHFNWGTGYARSYKPQQVIEDSILKEIEKEPARFRGKVVVILSGGGHVYCSMLYKGVIFILLPCLQSRTGFINGLGKISDVGFLIHSITYSKDGTLTRFGTEYFDRTAKALAFLRKRKNLHRNVKKSRARGYKPRTVKAKRSVKKSKK
ncbi:MAG: hypothetical protein COU29_03220 [Candidatus Magasanikbacteria bacterium CG10_big_fil_rev_8_21_14_0_10_36_32]|uniref:Uncharacterized protein n=1 Tax=Candidatus Magasanikbacteria bacterium CG10_big_fil_rev_8_21_14_0_10_36_32 TaxID=1974646 RepID=A0A2M6W636_9BACT|nr:MAG: hypothetical protein COU29_03220 [Candidatus Magasanikbacteria bacterium CG10_big_fil_rev_8_21_14_0_10_36_32]